MVLQTEYQHFRKTTFAIRRWFWKRFGALSGLFGGLLGVSWGRFGASRSIREGLQIRLGTLLGLVGSLLAADDGFGSVLGLSLARFGCSRGPFRGCFGLRQTDFDHQNCLSELRNSRSSTWMPKSTFRRHAELQIFEILVRTRARQPAPSSRLVGDGWGSAHVD